MSTVTRSCSLGIKGKEKEKELKVQAKKGRKWDEEGWELLNPSKQKLQRVVQERDAGANLRLFCSRGLKSRLVVFLWMYPLLERVANEEKPRFLKKYFFATAIRIHINALNSTSAERKSSLEQFWNDEKFCGKFRPISRKYNVAYQYRKWSPVFTRIAAKIDDWYLFSIRWSAAINRGEYLASDEKNYKTRCKSNPMVSMVREKANAVVGIWFFEMACFLGGKAYLIATRPAKAMKQDKGLEIWAEWVAHFLPDVHELPTSSSTTSSKKDVVLGLNICDSLYGSGGSAACFDEKKIPFLIGLRRGVFPHVEAELNRAVRLPGQFAVAWSHKLGRAIVCVYPSTGNARKYCFTNAYQVVPQLDKIKTGGVIDQEQLITYVTTGKRPDFIPNYAPSVLRPNPPPLLPSPPPVLPSPLPDAPPNSPNTLPNSSPALPPRVYEVICPCPCGRRFWVKTGYKGASTVHVSIPYPDPKPSKKRKKSVIGLGEEVEGVGMEVEGVEGGGEGGGDGVGGGGWRHSGGGRGGGEERGGRKREERGKRRDGGEGERKRRQHGEERG